MKESYPLRKTVGVRQLPRNLYRIVGLNSIDMAGTISTCEQGKKACASADIENHGVGPDDGLQGLSIWFDTAIVGNHGTIVAYAIHRLWAEDKESDLESSIAELLWKAWSFCGVQGRLLCIGFISPTCFVPPEVSSLTEP